MLLDVVRGGEEEGNICAYLLTIIVVLVGTLASTSSTAAVAQWVVCRTAAVEYSVRSRLLFIVYFFLSLSSCHYLNKPASCGGGKDGCERGGGVHARRRGRVSGC